MPRASRLPRGAPQRVARVQGQARAPEGPAWVWNGGGAEAVTPTGAEPWGGHAPAMAQEAGPPLRRPTGARGQEPRPGALPRLRRLSRGQGSLVTAKRLRAWAAADCLAAPEYQPTPWNAGPSWAPPLDGSCRATRPLGKPAEPQPQLRLVSPRPAPAREPRRPSTAEGAALPAGRRPLPSLSSRCRKAESEGAPVQPFAPHAERPGPRGGSALGDDAGDCTWACGAVG